MRERSSIEKQCLNFNVVTAIYRRKDLRFHALLWHGDANDECEKPRTEWGRGTCRIQKMRRRTKEDERENHNDNP